MRAERATGIEMSNSVPNKVLQRVGALTEDISYKELFSLPYNTAKGIRTGGGTTEVKRGVSDHTTNNRYSLFSFMKFHKMSIAYFHTEGAYASFADRNAFYSHIRTLPLDDRANIENEIEIYSAIKRHMGLIIDFLKSSKDGLTLESNSQVIAEVFASSIEEHQQNMSTKTTNIFRDIHLSTYSLDTLLFDEAYIHFILFFIRLTRDA